MTITKLNPATSFTTRQFNVSISKEGRKSASITAPTVSGYTFLCWLQPATNGWVSSVYTENPTSASTNIWHGEGYLTTGTGMVRCTALYVKTA